MWRISRPTAGRFITGELIILLVLFGESANLLSMGAVDFGIIVDSAVILVENIFRNFQARSDERAHMLQRLAEGFWGARSHEQAAACRRRSMDRSFAFPHLEPEAA